MGAPFALVLAVGSAGVTLAGQGLLDPSFGDHGVARIPLGVVDSVGGLALQGDGKIVAAVSAGSFITLVRLTGLGAVDVTFAGGTVRTTDPGPPLGVVVANGTIHTGGVEYFGQTVSLFLLSFDERGNIGKGAGTLFSPGLPINGPALALGGAGRVLMLWSSGRIHQSQSFVFAFGSDGLDTSFAGNGILSTEAVAGDLAQKSGGGPPLYHVSAERPAFAVDQESVVLLADFTTDFPDPTPGVLGVKLLRYDSKGQLDGSFGTGGVVDVLGPGDPEQIVLAPQLYPGGKIITAGSELVSQNHVREQMWAARTNVSGQPDSTFGGSGIVLVDSTNRIGDAYTASVSVAPDGKIVLVGSSNPGQTGPTFYLVRLRSDGTPDPTFGGSGVAVEPLAPFERTPQIVIQPNGDILAFGRALVVGSDPQEFDLAVARYVGNPCGDGTVDPGEACDDGEAANGTPDSCCTATCGFKPASTSCAQGTCNGTGVCVPPGCGDGSLDAGEQCDEGAAANGTAASCCTAGCQFKPPATACTGGTCNAAGGCIPRGPATCGNGVVEDGEQCDDGNTTSGDCCSATCGIEGASQVCRHSTNPCVKDDHCDGNAPTCNVGGFEPPGATVCAVPNSCTLEDYCDGAGTCVPGERVCSATFQTLKGAPGVAVACQSKTAATCTISFRIAGGVPQRAAAPGAGIAAAQRACPGAPPPGAPADDLFRGTGAQLTLSDGGGKVKTGLPFGGKKKLKLSKAGLRVYRCTDLVLEGTATITRDDGTRLTQKEQLRLLTKKLRGKR